MNIHTLLTWRLPPRNLKTIPTTPFDWTKYGAVLFDLDGVITPTAKVHERAWANMFNAYLATRPDQPEPYTDADYFAYIDGKPRYDGVRDFLASRGIELPHGSVDDDPDTETVCGLGNRKNQVFNEVLETEGVEAYPGSITLLAHLAIINMPVAIVSSSKNATAVLAAAGLTERFPTVVDGKVAVEVGLKGKPAPHMFEHAAFLLGVPDHRVRRRRGRRLRRSGRRGRGLRLGDRRRQGRGVASSRRKRAQTWWSQIWWSWPHEKSDCRRSAEPRPLSRRALAVARDVATTPQISGSRKPCS